MIKKKFLCAAAATVLACCFTGCGEYKADSSDRLSVVTTCFPPYDFARAVMGDTADITMLLCPGAEAHSYEPAPLDIAKIQNCDVFVYLGGEGEVWVDRILDSVDTSDMEIICLSDYAEKLPEEYVAGASPSGHDHNHSHAEEEMEECTDTEHDHAYEEEETDHDHSHESEDGHYDEHIWTSPKNAQHCVEGIRDALCTAYSENAELYKENSALYITQLEELHEELEEMTENAPSDLIVIGDRFPFRYLTHDYDLEYFAAFSGCSSESEPGVYTMAFLIDEIIEHETDTVFYLEFSTKKLAEKLCDATGAEMLPLQSCHNVTAEDFEKGTTYIELMRQNINNLREALY